MTDGWCSLRTRKEDQETGSSDWQGRIMVLEDLRAPAVWRNAQTHTFEWFGYTKQALFQNKFWLLVDHNCSFIFCKSDLTSGLWKYTKKLKLILVWSVISSHHSDWFWPRRCTTIWGGTFFSPYHSQLLYRSFAAVLQKDGTFHSFYPSCWKWIVSGVNCVWVNSTDKACLCITK